jgi:hypothetical protein
MLIKVQRIVQCALVTFITFLLGSSCLQEATSQENPAWLLGAAGQSIPIENQMDIAMQFNLEAMDRLGFFWFQSDDFPRPRLFSAIAVLPDSLALRTGEHRVPLLAWVDGSRGILYWMKTPSQLHYHDSGSFKDAGDMVVLSNGQIVLYKGGNRINTCAAYDNSLDVAEVPACTDIELSRVIQGLESLGNRVLAFDFYGFVGYLENGSLTPGFQLPDVSDVIAVRSSADRSTLAIVYNQGRSLRLIDSEGATIWDKQRIIIESSERESDEAQVQDIAPLGADHWVAITESHGGFAMYNGSGKLVSVYSISSLPIPFYTPRNLFSIRSAPDRGFLFVREKRAITGYSQYLTLSREEMYDYLPDGLEPVLFAVAERSNYAADEDMFESGLPAFLIEQARNALD